MLYAAENSSKFSYKFNVRIIMTMNPYLTFFHNSRFNWKETPALFRPLLREENKKELLRPTFYWFNDMYHHYQPWIEPYFYLFVKNTKQDRIHFKSRHENQDFNSLCVHQFDEYLKERVGKKLGEYFEKNNLEEYSEPSIILSFDNIEPDLVIKFSGERDKYGAVIKPDTHKGMKIYLFDENHYPIKFTAIPEIIDIVPKINYSYPFITPNKMDGKYVYEDWLPMKI